jgi:multicomponent K+:H+ antiporter subunit E
MKLFFLLLALWLVLNESIAPGHVLLGAAIAAGAAAAFARLQAGQPGHGARRPWTAVRLAFRVAADIIRSNVAVARIVLGLRRGTRTPGFLPIPLALRAPAGLAALACIVTATPGTSWVRYDRDLGLLTLHVLDLADPDATVSEFKQRYETPLMEIFE